MPKVTGINHRQVAFINEYMIDRCQYKAAIRAGYSVRSSRKIAARLMRDDHIRFEIERLGVKHSEDCGVSARRILEEYKSIAFSNLLDVVNLKGQPDIQLMKDLDLGAAVKAIKVDEDTGGIVITLHSKTRALHDLSKYMKMFVDKVEVTIDQSLGDRLKKARERSRK